MGILGNVKLKRRSIDVVIGLDDAGVPVTLTVRPPRLGQIDALETRVPEPAPPTLKRNGKPVVKMMPGGKDPVRDSRGGIVLERDEEDPKYLRDIGRREKAMTIALILDCLGDQVTPMVPVDEIPPEMNLIDYYHAVWAELEEAGLDVGSFKALSNAAVELGDPMSKDEVEAARAELLLNKETQAELRDELRDKGEEVPEGKSE